MTRSKDGSLYGIGGLDFHLLQILSSFYPFRYGLLNRNDSNFGTFNDGKWTGIMGMLNYGEADMSICRMEQTPTRMQGADFSFPYMVDTKVFVTAAPGIRQGDIPFIEPFHVMVWWFLLLSLPISSATVYLLSFPRRRKETWISGWMNETFKLIALLFGQGSHASYQKTREHVFMYHWALSRLVLVFSYCSLLLAFLMVPRIEKPLRTVQELKEAVMSGKYQFATFAGTSIMASVLEAKTGVFKVLADHLNDHQKNKLTQDDNAFVKLLTEQRLAVLMPRSYFTFAASEHGSDDRFHIPGDNFGIIPMCVVIRKGTGVVERVNILFHISGDNFWIIPMCVVIRKGTGVVERVNILIHRVTQAGIYAKDLEYKAFRTKIKRARPEPPATKRSLSFTDIKSALQLLGAGLLAGTCCLIGEICIHRWQTSRKKRKGKRGKTF